MTGSQGIVTHCRYSSCNWLVWLAVMPHFLHYCLACYCIVPDQDFVQLPCVAVAHALTMQLQAVVEQNFVLSFCCAWLLHFDHYKHSKPTTALPLASLALMDAWHRDGYASTAQTSSRRSYTHLHNKVSLLYQQTPCTGNKCSQKDLTDHQPKHHCDITRS